MPRVGSLLAAAGVLAVAACSSSRADARTAAPSNFYIVGVDVSGSQTQTRRQEGQDLVNGLIGRLSYGDRVTIVETYRARSDSAGQWTDSVPWARTPQAPTGNDRRRLAQFQQKARMMTGDFFTPDSAHPVMTTDLLAMLQRAADYARAAGGRRTTLLLVSDMLNATPELNMERAGWAPEPKWIAARKAQGTLPDLRGVCVVVAGADVSSKRGAQVREFWKQYFTATGATFRDENYRTMIADAAQVGCS